MADSRATIFQRCYNIGLENGTPAFPPKLTSRPGWGCRNTTAAASLTACGFEDRSVLDRSLGWIGVAKPAKRTARLGINRTLSALSARTESFER